MDRPAVTDKKTPRMRNIHMFSTALSIQDYVGREKRKSPRVLTFKTGKIVCLANDLEMLAAILDISEGGACLLVPDVLQVPDRFHFFLDGKPEILSCAVRWKSGHRVGIRFL